MSISLSKWLAGGGGGGGVWFLLIFWGRCVARSAVAAAAARAPPHVLDPNRSLTHPMLPTIALFFMRAMCDAMMMS